MPDLSDLDSKTIDPYREELLTRIDALVDNDLSEWEEAFLSSIKNRVEEGRVLSEKQEETLHKIELKYLDLTNDDSNYEVY